MRDVLAPSVVRAGPGLEVECSFTPAADGVSGDFYLVAPGPDEDSTVLAVGDVSGKGIEAARRATFVRTSLATFAGFVDDPCRLLELSNQVLVERTGTSSVFVTAVAVDHPPARGPHRLGHGRPPAADAPGQRRAAQRRVPSPPLASTARSPATPHRAELGPGAGCCSSPTGSPRPTARARSSSASAGWPSAAGVGRLPVAGRRAASRPRTCSRTRARRSPTICVSSRLEWTPDERQLQGAGVRSRDRAPRGHRDRRGRRRARHRHLGPLPRGHRAASSPATSGSSSTCRGARSSRRAASRSCSRRTTAPGGRASSS